MSSGKKSVLINFCKISGSFKLLKILLKEYNLYFGISFKA